MKTFSQEYFLTSSGRQVSSWRLKRAGLLWAAAQSPDGRGAKYLRAPRLVSIFFPRNRWPGCDGRRDRSVSPQAFSRDGGRSAKMAAIPSGLPANISCEQGCGAEVATVPSGSPQVLSHKDGCSANVAECAIWVVPWDIGIF